MVSLSAWRTTSKRSSGLSDPRHLAPPHVFLHFVHLGLIDGRLPVHGVHERRDGREHVAKDKCPDDEGHHAKGAFGVVGRNDVAVPDRGQSSERPVQRIQVLNVWGRVESGAAVVRAHPGDDLGVQSDEGRRVEPEAAEHVR